MPSGISRNNIRPAEVERDWILVKVHQPQYSRLEWWYFSHDRTKLCIHAYYGAPASRTTIPSADQIEVLEAALAS